MTSNRPHIVYRERSNATTWSLVHDVTEAARMSAAALEWPRGIPSKDAARIMHGVAADVRYVAEDGVQMIRAPWITIQHGRADCKSTAVLIAAMCKAAGRRVQLKFLQYEPGPTHWAHVYAVVDGVPADPLLDFGNEFPYFSAHTVTV